MNQKHSDGIGPERNEDKIMFHYMTVCKNFGNQVFITKAEALVFLKNAPLDGVRNLFQGNYAVTPAGFAVNGKEWLIGSLSEVAA